MTSATSAPAGSRSAGTSPTQTSTHRYVCHCVRRAASVCPVPPCQQQPAAAGAEAPDGGGFRVGRKQKGPPTSSETPLFRAARRGTARLEAACRAMPRCVVRCALLSASRAVHHPHRPRPARRRVVPCCAACLAVLRRCTRATSGTATGRRTSATPLSTSGSTPARPTCCPARTRSNPCGPSRRPTRGTSTRGGGAAAATTTITTTDVAWKLRGRGRWRRPT